MRKLLILVFLAVNSLALAQLNPGQIGNDQVLCYGSSPAALSFIIPPSGGSAPYAFRWQRSNDAGYTWTDITGTNGSRTTYSPPVLGRSTRFRCMVTDAASASSFSNTVTITVGSTLTAGTVGNPQTIYSGTSPAPLVELTAASGGTGVFSYQWQSSFDGLHWTDIRGATSAGYIPHEMIDDTWFRRFVVDANCGSTSSNTVRVSANPVTLYTTETPRGFSDWGRWDYGTEFIPLTGGFITMVRIFGNNADPGPDIVGNHTIRFWSASGTSGSLIAGPYSWNITNASYGWYEFNLPEPLAVEANKNYIVSVSNDNNWFGQRWDFIPAGSNDLIRYVRARLSTVVGNFPGEDSDYGFFRDVGFIPFTPGSAGLSQAVCYNTIPAPLTQIAAPTGAAGTYSFQWQSSPDGVVWTNIQGATSQDYSPSALTASTYFRRMVISAGLATYSVPVLIRVSRQFSSAQIHGTSSVYENTSTYFNIELSGGLPPYTVTYTRNGSAPTTIENYTSGTDIYTGILTAGTYTYSVVSVTDAAGCTPQSTGHPVTITASGSYNGQGGNKALVIVNSNSLSYYYNYTNYIKTYLDWFGVPYDICNISSDSLPALDNYAVIIFGHRDVYDESYPEGQQEYPMAQLENALSNGTGLYSFDPHLFDFPSAFNVPGEHLPDLRSNRIDIRTNHYITRLHAKDNYVSKNDTIYLHIYGELPYTDSIKMHIWATDYQLVGAEDLATMSFGGITEPLLQVSTFGNGRIVKWCAYGWVFDDQLGAVYGMDDLVWRGIVWAARKPFVLQGMPPIVTMRVDDVDGYGSELETNFEWLRISNEFGFIPWCGTFITTMPQQVIPTLRNLINNNLATASPHAFNYEDYIYVNYEDSQNPVPDKIIAAGNFYSSNNLPMSKYMVPHAYLIRSEGISEISNLGIEFIGTKIPYDRNPDPDLPQGHPDRYPGNSLEIGPYLLNHEPVWAGTSHPFFFADSINWFGNPFFICLSEINDDNTYEWRPDYYYAYYGIEAAIARGVRHLRRALDGMFLPVLFTHEQYLSMTPAIWRQILSGVTNAISSYNPQYKSTDYAAEYIRAKKNLKITNVTSDNGLISISCSGVNDMETRAWLFTESDNQISMRLLTLPRVTSSQSPVTIGVSN